MQVPDSREQDIVLGDLDEEFEVWEMHTLDPALLLRPSAS